VSDVLGLLERIAKLETRFSKSVRHGTVQKGEGGKVRLKFGVNPDGSDHVGPWVFPGQHNGFLSEDTPFKEGQNVTLISMGGDPRTGILLPYSPNDANKRPDHATNDAATTQIRPKEGSEKGNRTTSTDKEHTRQVNETSTTTQTNEQLLHKVNDAAGNIVASVTHKAEQVLRELKNGNAIARVAHTAQQMLREITGGSGPGSKILHTLDQVLHQVGDAASTKLTATSLLHQLGDAKSLLSPTGLLNQLGNVKSLLSADGIKHLVGEVGMNVMAAGANVVGGLFTHDGVDIGKTHVHGVNLGRLGFFLTQIPGGGSGGGGGAGGGDTPPPTPTDPSTLDGLLDAGAVAWGGFIIRPSATNPSSAVTLKGRQSNIATYELLGYNRVRVTLDTMPNDDAAYQVFAQAAVPGWSLVDIQNGNFTLQLADGEQQVWVWFRVYA
jgi:hypothetical protein